MNREALSLVESFVFVAQELNFQRGAAKMNIDRSALTRRIQKLEHLLGFTLFERTTREVSLTPAGRAFYESNTHILQDFGNSIDAARRIACSGFSVRQPGCGYQARIYWDTEAEGSACQ